MARFMAARGSPTTGSCGAGRSRTSRASGPRSGSGSRSTARLRARPRPPGDARRRMVPRRRAELRRARLPAGPAGRHGNPPRHRVTGRGRDRLGRASRAGRPLRRRAAAAGRRTRRPRGRLHAERPETVVALLATASIGAIWSSCAPEFGTPTVVDRFRQIEPGLDRSRGLPLWRREFDRRERVREIEAAIPSLEHVVMVPSDWARLLAEPAELTFERVPFDHPLWVLYVRHDRAAQGDRAGPRRHPARALEEDTRTWRRTTASSGLRPPGG